MVSHNLQTVTVFTSSFPSCIPFIFLFWLPWLGLRKLCRMQVVGVGILALLLTFEEMLHGAHCWKPCCFGVSFWIFSSFCGVTFAQLFMFCLAFNCSLCFQRSKHLFQSLRTNFDSSKTSFRPLGWWHCLWELSWVGWSPVKCLLVSPQ